MGEEEEKELERKRQPCSRPMADYVLIVVSYAMRESIRGKDKRSLGLLRVVDHVRIDPTFLTTYKNPFLSFPASPYLDLPKKTRKNDRLTKRKK